MENVSESEPLGPLTVRQSGADISAPNYDFNYAINDLIIDPPILNEPELPAAAAFPTYNLNDIKVEYHLSSGIVAKTHGFDTFQCCPTILIPPPDKTPWHPFKSQLEFKIAELALEVRLNHGKEKTIFKNHKDIHNLWEAASHCVTKFMKEVILVHFDGDSELWDYEYDGTTFVHFVDEPFTVQDIWDIQSKLPPGTKPLAYILWLRKNSMLESQAGLILKILFGMSCSPELSHPWYQNLKQASGLSVWMALRAGSFCNYEELHLSKLCMQKELQKNERRSSKNKCFVILSFEAFPHWWNLKHPNKVIGVAFTDSAVHEGISKMIIYATHNILTEQDLPLGYLLLRCIHLYLEMDMYAVIEVHMANTIHEGRHTVQAFAALMKQYITQMAEDIKKNWNFLKLHMTTHIFDDIEAKGTSCNYNTKPNEPMHGSLKDWYLNRTNFKNIAEQILHIDHWILVADYDNYVLLKSQDVEDDVIDDEDNKGAAVITTTGSVFDPSLHVKIRSRQAPQTFIHIQSVHQGDNAFTDFCTKLNEFINASLPACNTGGRRFQFQPDDSITEF
ncbi:uncharacterized protein BJ212DRAFT_1297041 [Suillus subaureus]|uniref:Uncharacterized protein n=1 Tax=Suillus subaureus TaxID=48587 RepID=A0A9P7EI51_9AGAM|nr:uncharacterized protein BJ212DRAFT_1297041 [Suillus subaureus]KAG1821702.1 hypothetical protein BJ212DRAFT_1297041 [Suillus subaureus]